MFTCIYLIMKFIYLLLSLLMLSSCSSIKKASTIYNECIFVDPGHGGKDNGCSFENIYEDEINLKIATKIYELLLNNDIKTFISRQGDYDLASLYAKNRKNEDLKKRVKLMEELHCTMFVSLHLNSYKDSSVHGPMVYYRQGDDKSFELAKIIQEDLNIFTNQNKSCHFENFYLFRKTKITGVLIECGFLSNYKERKKLLNSEYQNLLSKVILNSILKYLNLN